MVTESDVTELLREQFGGEDWAFFAGVRDATGFAAKREIDGLAMGLWPSRGLALHAFEIKVSRSDWLRELKQPAKADIWFSRVDHFWLVIADPSIVKDGELPATWGLMAAKPNGGLRVVRAAPPLSPAPMDRKFLASILRHAMRTSPSENAIKKAVEAAVAAEQKRGEEWRKQDLARIGKTTEELRRAIQDFEKASGIQITTWDAGRVGEAVRRLVEGEHWRERAAKLIAREATDLEQQAAKLREAVRELESAKTASASEQAPLFAARTA